MANNHPSERCKDEEKPLEYCLRKYLLLLAIMVATVTYTAGFNPPGGVWQDTEAGHLAGDSIIRDTLYPRYLVFFYCNAAAFAMSIVVIIIIFILALIHDKKQLWISMIPLRMAMVLDLLGLVGAYAAGTSRAVLKPRNAWVLVVIFVYMVIQLVLTLSSGAGDGKKEEAKEQLQTADGKEEKNNQLSQPGVKKEEEKERRRKLLLLLATFVMSATYLAGLSAPGGYWDSSKEGHNAGDPVMREHHAIRLKAFFVFNAAAFVMSLLIIMLLLDKQLVIPLLQDQDLSMTSRVRTRFLKAYIIIALFGLVGAYATGSSRNSDTTIYVGCLVFAVLACIIFLKVIISPHPQGSASDSNGRPSNGVKKNTINGGVQTNTSNADILEKAQSLVVLLSTLVTTITYQAGLVPPGGVWQENWKEHEAGDPILLSIQPERYKVFFYCNSIAFAASLVIIILVQYKPILKRRILELAMILDLFGLIGAYSAGSCRDVTTSIYVIALAGVVLVYVVIHVIFITLDEDMGKKGGDKDMKDEGKRRKRLLLFAVLCTTLTYQAGLTPPGGFWLKDDEFGHHAGEPVLSYNYPRRYKAFLYCNSMSFMSSIALIILLVNPNLYKPAIRSYALSVCTALGMFALMCTYAAGSTQHLKTSIYIFGLVALVLFIMIVVLICFVKKEMKSRNPQDEERGGIEKSPATQDEHVIEQENKTLKPSETKSGGEIKEDDRTTKSADIEDAGEAKKNTSNETNEKEKGERTATESNKKENESKKHAKRKYLMLLGVLAASVTYQAGLNPPGGVWQGNSNGHAAGNPVMHDNKRYRYLIFFYSNSASFVASIVVIILLLKEKLLREDWLFKVMNITIVLNLLGLLLAYMAGSRMRLESSGYFITFVIAALGIAAIHKIWSLNKESK
uniref:PGG domain-containing protein n=1 Tax=Oryza punctata TaxID=4537 RepID=A0A0E0LAM6_ORYPU